MDELSELSAPYHVVTINGQVFERGVASLRVASARDTPADRACVELKNIDGELSGVFIKGDSLLVEWGYRGGARWAIFNGVVRQVVEGDVLEIYGMDRMADLFDTRLTMSFVDETDGGIIRWALGEAGVSDMAVHDEGVVFPRCNIFNRSASQVIETVNRTLTSSFGVSAARDYRWFFDVAGKFHYGPYSETDNGRNGADVVPALAYMDNLLGLRPAAVAGGLSWLRTVAIPYLRHSMPIKVREPVFGKIDGEYRVERVEYKQAGNRMRCDVWFTA